MIDEAHEYVCHIDGSRIDDSNRLRILREEEVLGERSPQQVDEAVSRYESVRDSGRFMEVKRLRPEQLKYMTAVEKRLLKDWIVAQADEFDRKAALIERHMGSEPDLPDLYRANGAA